jgi:hypothetical protein
MPGSVHLYNISEADQAAVEQLGGQVDGEENVSLSNGQIFLLVYLLVVFLVGATANLSALLTFVRKSSLRTTSNR